MVPPISDSSPCGDDLEYDAQFMEMELAGNGKPEQQYGSTVIPAKPPDWTAVLELCEALSRRTHDVRVAVWHLRASAHRRGWGGAVQSLARLHALLSEHWEQAFPRPDPDLEIPLLPRLSALSPLSPQDSPYPAPPAFLVDLRQARLVESDRNSPLIRDIELGLRAAEPAPGEMLPTEAGIVAAVAGLLPQHPGLADAMKAGLQALDGINAILGQHLAAQDLPDFAQLRAALAALARAADLALGNAAPAPDAPAAAAPGAAAAVPAAAVAAAAGTINSREDVSRSIDKLCDWLERNEPSHPAPLLLRRAQRLLKMNFLEIIQDMAPDGTDQVIRLAGRTDKD